MSKMAEFIKGCTTCQPEIDMILIQSLHNSHLIGQCITCSILSRALNDDRLQIPEDCPESSWASLYIKRPSFPLSNLHISRKMHPDREEYERVAHIEIYTPVSAPQNLIQHGNDVLSTFDMVDAVSIARRWLHSCLNYHSNNPFRPHRGIFQLPNRVLDVSLSKTGLLRLVDKTQVDLLYGGLNTEYATLSHCWGSEQNVQSTTRANFIERMQCFEMKELSRTLQEAILFTLALGINYLWVDCLCIIQDSRGDWEYESSRMHGIYRLSYLNISAVSGENGSSGLFNPRWAPEVSAPARRSPVESLEVGEFEVPSETFACKINLKIMVRFSLSRAHEDITNPSEMQGIDPVSPLLTRGWAFQERIFSLRTISFHAAELTWDCQHEIKCECGTSGSVDHTEQATNFTKQYIGKFYEARDRWGADFIEQSEEDWEGGITNPWHEIVSQFSTLKLTMASDRLPALSGMAQYFDAYMKSGVRGTQYLAGLWRDSLVKDLCWYVQVSENHCAPARAKPYRAPTWSWASVDLKDDQYSASPILYQPDMSSKFEQSTRLIVRHMETTLAGKDDVRHGETHHATRDYHGAVSGGLLRIRCILIEANVVLHPRRDREHVRRHTVQFSERDPLDQHCPPEFLPNLYLDISFMEPTQKSLADDPVSSDAMALDMTFDTTSLTKEGSMDQDGYLCTGSKVWICMLGQITDGGICALALREVGRVNFPRFERVGYLYNEVAQHGEQFDGWSNNFMRRVERGSETAIEIL